MIKCGFKSQFLHVRCICMNTGIHPQDQNELPYSSCCFYNICVLFTIKLNMLAISSMKLILILILQRNDRDIKT